MNRVVLEVGVDILYHNSFLTVRDRSGPRIGSMRDTGTTPRMVGQYPTATNGRSVRQPTARHLLRHCLLRIADDYNDRTLE